MFPIVLALYLLQVITSQVSGQEMQFSVSKDVSDNIYLYYYEGPTFKNPVALQLKDGLNLTSQPGFDVNIHSIFYFHGWGENATKGSTKEVLSAFLKKKVHNLIAVDYSKLTKNTNIFSYLGSSLNVTEIGQALGQFFKKYVQKQQKLQFIEFISHSLGSQVMAATCREFGKGKIPFLTALDPAGPLFNFPLVSHLDKSDGKYVKIIHSDGGFYGDGRTLGTVDFFPNHGTRIQPGCEDGLVGDITGFCSHHRSYQYFSESILNPGSFLAKHCNRTILFAYCCCDNSTTYMGYNHDTSITGTYWLTTGSESPYALGDKGIQSID